WPHDRLPPDRDRRHRVRRPARPAHGEGDLARADDPRGGRRAVRLPLLRPDRHGAPRARIPPEPLPIDGDLVTDMKHITIHSTTTCQPCRTAKKRMDAAGVPYTEVLLDLPENAEYLAELKRRLERE